MKRIRHVRIQAFSYIEDAWPALASNFDVWLVGDTCWPLTQSAANDGPPIAIVLFSCARDEAEARGAIALAAGAADYVHLEEATGPILAHAIRGAVARRAVAGPAHTAPPQPPSHPEAADVLQLVMEAVHESVAVVNENGVFEYLNTIAAQRMGSTPDAFIGKTIWQLFPPEQAEFYAQALSEAIGHNKMVHREVAAVLGGERRWFRTTTQPLRQESSRLRSALVFAVDVTEYRKVQAALQQSEELFRAIATQAVDAIFCKDADLRCTFVNPALERMFERPASELIGARADALLPPELAARVRRSDRRTLAGHTIDATLPLTVGTKAYVLHVIQVPIRDEAKQIVGLCGIVRDITEQQRMEEALRDSESRARAFQDSLTALHDVTTELSKAASVESLCQQAIELGRTRLGFERLGLWFSEDRTGCMRGSFGTDDHGSLRDERHERIPIAPHSPWDCVLNLRRRLVVQPEGEILDNAGHPLAPGWSAFAGMWDGEAVVGVLCADNLLKHAPLTDERARLLTLYASAIGHLYSLRRREDDLELFRSVVQNSREAIAIADSHGTILHANPAQARLFHIGAEQIVGTSLAAGLTPDCARFHAEEVAPHVLDTGSWEGEVTAVDGHGRHFPAWRRLDVIRAASGEPAFVISLMHDISEARHAQDELRQSEERFRAQFKSIPVPTFAWRHVGERFVLIDYNDAAVHLTRGRIAEFVGCTDLDLHGDEPHTLECFQTCYRDRTVVRQDIRRRLHTTGEVREFQASFAFAPPDLVLVHALDVTHRNASDRALRESEEKFRTLSERIGDGIVVTVDGVARWVNLAFANMVGRSRDSLLGKRIPEFLVGDAEAEHALAFGASLEGSPAPQHCELRVKRPDGLDVVMDVMASLIPFGGRDAVAIVARDVSDRKRDERTIAEQRLSMLESARLSSVGEMASGIAHEINNPLAVVEGGVEQIERLIYDGRPDPETLRNLARTVVRNVGRIERIIRGLKDLSRDSARDPFTPASVLSIVDEALELSRMRFQNHGIELRVAEIPAQAEIECRGAQLAQVLLNLLNNAFDAVIEVEQKHVSLDFADRDDWIELAVTDSGPGLASGARHRAFEPFFTTKPEGRGTGLGLSISRSIVEGHGGSLRFDEASPRTRFVLSLPKRQQAPQLIRSEGVQ